MLLCLRKAGKDHTAMYWGKYNVTQSMFPPLHFYPSYCNGQCALLNRQAVEVKVNQNKQNKYHIHNRCLSGSEKIFNLRALLQKKNESILFDSLKWIKNDKKDFDSRGETKSFVLFLIHVGEWFYSWFWFILIPFDSFDSKVILICDSEWFYSFWFGLIFIRRESRFTRESWFTCESNRIKNQR